MLIENPAISIIIPAKDSAQTIEKCLSALKAQHGMEFGKDYEIILVDDGSTDNTGEIGERMQVSVIRQGNRGPAAARNSGAKAARGAILVFTDSDCVPQSDWVKEMVRPFNDLHVIGVKGAYLCEEKNKTARFVQMEFEFKYKAMASQSTIDFIDTYSAAYQRDVFLENNGFDENFPVPSVEDQELSFRLAGKGYKMVFQPLARVFHAHDHSIAEYMKRKWGIGYWKAVMLRWLPEKTFNDSYTPLSQRFQIISLAFLIISILLAPFNRIFLLTALSFGLLFLGSAVPFLNFIARKDPAILLPSIFILPLRAAASGFGLLFGFLFPKPLRKPSEKKNLLFEKFLKRILDIFVALVGLLLFSPIMLASIIAICLDSPGLPIFSQLRAGQNGKPFRLYKLRSMVKGAEDQVRDILAKNGNTLTDPAFKIQHDPRITVVGRFLRRWSIDELPQLWNILRGDMSLVGPRPEEIWVVALYNDHQRQRLAAKPGLTGPMQVSGRADLDIHSRVACELEYLNNFSLLNDLQIIWKSIGVVISGKGAY